MRRNPESRRGIALVAVLWVVMGLSAITLSFIAETRTGTQLTHNLVDNGAARALADGAVHNAIARLLKQRTQPDAVFDGRPTRISAKDATIEISIQDEAGKVNLNTASDALLEAVFRSAGLSLDEAKAMADKIGDWRDKDNLRRLNGAESADYRAAGKDYGAKNLPFTSVEELGLVLSMTRQLYARLKPSLTVYSNKRGVDLRAAPGPVLKSLFNDNEETATAFLEARRQADKQALNFAMQNFGVSRRFISSSPKSIFTIRAVVETQAGAKFSREAIVRLSGNQNRPHTFLAWRRASS